MGCSLINYPFWGTPIVIRIFLDGILHSKPSILEYPHFQDTPIHQDSDTASVSGQSWETCETNTSLIWGFPSMGVPLKIDGLHGNIPLKINDLGVPLFQETTICNPFVNFVFSKMVWVVEGSLGRILGHPHVFVAKYCGLGQNQTNIDLECEDIYI